MTTIILSVILVIYISAIGLLIYGFLRIKKYQKKDLNPKTSFRIIVPFRNEAENLPNLLNSLSNVNYPADLFEVILVDDNSKEEFHVSGFRFHVPTKLET